MDDRTITITISGPQGSGKSGVYVEVLAALRELGLDVRHADETTFRDQNKAGKVHSSFYDHSLPRPTILLEEITTDPLLCPECHKPLTRHSVDHGASCDNGCEMYFSEQDLQTAKETKIPLKSLKIQDLYKVGGAVEPSAPDPDKVWVRYSPSRIIRTSYEPIDSDFDYAAQFYASRAMGRDKATELHILKERYEKEDVDSLVYLFMKNRIETSHFSVDLHTQLRAVVEQAAQIADRFEKEKRGGSGGSFQESRRNQSELIAKAIRDMILRDPSTFVPNAESIQLDAELYLWKWVERGLFDKHTSPKDALEVMAYYPSAPWQKGRWNVDHKPYAKPFYKTFPKAEDDAASRKP